ncbi:MAG: epimerase [Deltaproteobacteria bacterium]|nr:epimerase [Deltaproteobacteria bacterium]|tara:strand:- start:7808 stop:9337 length:1530 start_codon:yes stop_codon:yes gene_type:complete
MTKYRVFLTGATGAMGFLTFQALLKERDELQLVLLALPTKQDRKKLKPFKKMNGVEIHWGDLRSYDDVRRCVEGCDLILHMGAFVSPAADYEPEKAVQINFGAMYNIVNAVKDCKQQDTTKIVNIGTIAETGDRMPPIHWGRIGDPIKTSIYDYYAVSKVAAERYLIESGLPHWVSLRQTGMMGPAMIKSYDAIIFHNCLDNVLEYVSDRDSARLMRNLCYKERTQQLDETFWGHIFNIGGGEDCQLNAYDMYTNSFQRLGLSKLSDVMDSKWYATRNFHGQYYLDSDVLNDLFDFRRDTLDYHYHCFEQNMGLGKWAVKGLTSLPGGKKGFGSLLHKNFLKLARTAHGTVRFIEQDMEEKIAAYWGSYEAWKAIPHLDQWTQPDFEKVVHIDHGYDEDQPEHALRLQDMKEAATFRGGTCLSDDMQVGDWTQKLQFQCAFDHTFEASPRLVLEGGHWCPVCERESWNGYERARRDPFFAQVWDPLHPKDETPFVVKKRYSEKTFKPNL